jgi:uncharacterized protein (DUF58 family)
MSRSLSPRVPGALALAGGAVVAGLASGRPELVVLATPFLVLIGIGLAVCPVPRLAAEVNLERTRLLEGDSVLATVSVRNDGTASVDVELAVARTRHLLLEPDGHLILRLTAGERSELKLNARPRRWGAHEIGPVAICGRDPFGVLVWEARLGLPVALRSFPREQRLRQLVEPRRTQPFLGVHVARGAGAGVEFADIRPFAGGDRVRQVNWRATARRGALYVTERHPEHTSDVVLLIDTFAEARDAASGTLDAAVRAAASMARAHLARRDRVALVDFGGTLHWLEPAFGTAQLYRIIDALLASDIAFSYAWRAVESIPGRVLPPGAMIVAITPLLDERSIRLITDLRTRGRDVIVIEVSPLPYTSPGSTADAVLAHQLWRLQRQALRIRLQALGIAVAVWNQDGMLGAGLEGVNSFRCSAGPAAHA